MSAFEKLPREVRDLIYGYCLLYDGEIIPDPNFDEREQIKERGKEPAKACLGRVGAECKAKHNLRSCAGITYAADWPSVALLAVNKAIQEEAAVVLFGQNVWRLPFVERWEMGEEEDLWYRYKSHFRHITTHISMTDAGHLLEETKAVRTWAKKLRWSDNEVTRCIHEWGLCNLKNSFHRRLELLCRMHLKSLVFDVGNLFCPHGCCRDRVLHSFCQEMSLYGPWYRLKCVNDAGRYWEVTIYNDCLDVKTKSKIDVKVIGLEDDSEKKIFMDHWGLEAE